MSINLELEQVLVVPTSLFRSCGYFQGFNDRIEQFLPVLLDPGNTLYRPRAEMESDPSFKQLIPYCIFRFVDPQGAVFLFHYQRGANQGEQRLHRKKSIGIGGHICTLDMGDGSPYDLGMHRELQEEVRIRTDYRQQCVGLINDDETEVGKVHLGIVHLFDVDQPCVYSNEPDIIQSGFRPVAELCQQAEQFESWSQICLQSIFGQLH